MWSVRLHDDPENEWILKLFVGKTIPFNFNNRGRSLPSPPSRDRNFMHVQVNNNQSKQIIKFQKVPVDLIASRPEVVRKQPENFHYPPPHREDHWGVQHESAKTQLMLQKICLRVFTWPFTRRTKPLKQSDGQNQRQRQFISRHICWNSLLKLNTPRQKKTSRRRLTIPKRGFWYTCTLFAPQSYLTYLISIFAAK